MCKFVFRIFLYQFKIRNNENGDELVLVYFISGFFPARMDAAVGLGLVLGGAEQVALGLGVGHAVSLRRRRRSCGGLGAVEDGRSVTATDGAARRPTAPAAGVTERARGPRPGRGRAAW